MYYVGGVCVCVCEGEGFEHTASNKPRISRPYRPSWGWKNSMVRKTTFYTSHPLNLFFSFTSSWGQPQQFFFFRSNRMDGRMGLCLLETLDDGDDVCRVRKWAIAGADGDGDSRQSPNTTNNHKKKTVTIQLYTCRVWYTPNLHYSTVKTCSVLCIRLAYTRIVHKIQQNVNCSLKKYFIT